MNLSDERESLRKLLEEVPLATLQQYLEANELTLPSEPSREKLVDMLLESEYKKDIRAAIFVELKGASKLFERGINERKKELEKLSSSTEAKLAAIDGWKHLFQIASLIFGALAFSVTLFGGIRLINLQTDAAQAKQQLDSGQQIIEGYRQFMLRTVYDNVAVTMNSVSTRWFNDSDRPIVEDLAVYKENVVRLLKVADGTKSEDSKKTHAELQLLREFLEELEYIAQSSPPQPGSENYQKAEERWQELHNSLLRLEKSKAIDDRQLSRYQAYILNVRGVFAYGRFAALNSKSGRTDALRYLKQAKEFFRDAKKAMDGYSPASSNLGVALMDELDLKVKFGDVIKDTDFSEAEETLLKARDMRHQTTQAEARVYNNLAMLYLMRANSTYNDKSYARALGHLSSAEGYIEKALAMPSFPANALVSKAEISAFFAVVYNAQCGDVNCPSNSDFRVRREQVADFISRAAKREYDFGDRTRFFSGSSSFTAYCKIFEEQCRGTFDTVFRG